MLTTQHTVKSFRTIFWLMSQFYRIGSSSNHVDSLTNSLKYFFVFHQRFRVTLKTFPRTGLTLHISTQFTDQPSLPEVNPRPGSRGWPSGPTMNGQSNGNRWKKLKGKKSWNIARKLSWNIRWRSSESSIFSIWKYGFFSCYVFYLFKHNLSQVQKNGLHLFSLVFLFFLSSIVCSFLPLYLSVYLSLSLTHSFFSLSLSHSVCLLHFPLLSQIQSQTWWLFLLQVNWIDSEHVFLWSQN